MISRIKAWRGNHLQEQSSLLHRIAEDAPGLDPRSDTPELIGKLADAGLGPILYRLLVEPRPPKPVADLLLSSDLTAHLLMEQMSDATEEILRAAGAMASEIVLLKGIAAQRHYPQPHLRLMGDVDLLVPPTSYTQLQTLLLDLGYAQQSELPAAFFESHHHAMPFFHPVKRVWIEVHRGLFPPSWSCAQDPSFDTDTVLATSIPITFRGVVTRALSDETHLAYTCAHWAGSFSLSRGLLGVVDVIYLLRGGSLNWDILRRNAPRGWARRSVGLMFGFLQAQGAITLDSAAVGLVADWLRPLSRADIRVLYWLLDACLVRRRYGRLLTEPNVRNIWDGLLIPERPPYLNLLRLPAVLLFPPNREDRFSPMLAAKRARSFLRGP